VLHISVVYTILLAIAIIIAHYYFRYAVPCQHGPRVYCVYMEDLVHTDAPRMLKSLSGPNTFGKLS